MGKIILFFKCLFVWWRPKGQTDLSGAQIILTQAASDMVNDSSSQTNKLLAVAAKKYSEELNIPIFAQGEVAKALKEMGIAVTASTPCEAIPDNFGSKEYQGTSGVAVLQKKYCDELGLKRALIIAFVPHIWRAKWTYEKLGLEVIIPPRLPWCVFERQLNQHRWRRSITAYPYELKTRLEYPFKGLM